MPLYNFATYVDTREEWAIRADNLEQARELIGTDANGDWLDDAIRLDTEAIECRTEFAPDIETDLPAVIEITPDHWAWREAHGNEIERSLKQNIAAISAEFNTHHLRDPFYDCVGKYNDGSIGQYEFCIAMAEALTDWEIANGLGEAYDNAGVQWIELVEDFVETVLVLALHTKQLPDPAKILPTIQVLAGCREANRDDIQKALCRNVAAIACEFHMLCDSRNLTREQFDLCTAMAKALTDWEVGNGLGEAYDNLGYPWLDLVQDFVERFQAETIREGSSPNPSDTLGYLIEAIELANRKR